MLGFFMLKPESAFYIEKIEELIKQDGWKIDDILLIEDYYHFAYDIYKICHFHHDRDFFEIIIAEMKIETRLFGNHGLILMIKNENQKMLSFLQQLDDTKSKIRKEISVSKSRYLQAYINISKLNYNCNKAVKGIPKIVNNQEIKQCYKTKDNFGEYISLYLSYLHTPDVELERYLKQMEYIQNSHLKKITKKEFEFIKKHRTYYI